MSTDLLTFPQVFFIPAETLNIELNTINNPKEWSKKKLATLSVTKICLFDINIYISDKRPLLDPKLRHMVSEKFYL